MLATIVLRICLLSYGYVFNAVAKSVCNPVIPPASMPCTTFCIATCVLQSVCVHTMGFMIAYKQIN